MAVIALLVAASLSAEPSRLVLGKDGGADLELTAPAQAKINWSASVGSVSDVRRDGDSWKARFTPPTRRAPSVALILAQIEQGADRELAWLAIPLSGSDTMEIETKPGSNVQAEVAGSTIGPVTADARGSVRLPMVVPPGVKTGTLRITDKLGNMNEKPLDLEPPPFTRLRIAARGESAGPGEPIGLEIFVVRADGTPEDRAAPSIEADEGEAAIEERVAPGVWSARFTFAPGASGSAVVEARGAGQRASLEIPLRSAGGNAPRSARWDGRPWGLSAGLIGGGGATYDGAGSGSLLLDASVRIPSLPLEAVIEGGGSAFSEVTQGIAQGAVDARSRSWMLQGGVRGATQLARGLDGHAALLIGAQRQRVLLRAAAETFSWSWTPHLALAMGVNLRLGPGRALAQLQFDASRSGAAGLTGSLGGVQVQVGYLVAVR